MRSALLLRHRRAQKFALVPGLTIHLGNLALDTDNFGFIYLFCMCMDILPECV